MSGNCSSLNYYMAVGLGVFNIYFLLIATSGGQVVRRQDCILTKHRWPSENFMEFPPAFLLPVEAWH